jgi:hypothetical protein
VGVDNNWGVVRVRRGLASNEVGVLHPAIPAKPEAQVEVEHQSLGIFKAIRNSKNFVDYAENSKYSDPMLVPSNSPAFVVKFDFERLICGC